MLWSARKSFNMSEDRLRTTRPSHSLSRGTQALVGKIIRSSTNRKPLATVEGRLHVKNVTTTSPRLDMMLQCLPSLQLCPQMTGKGFILVPPLMPPTTVSVATATKPGTDRRRLKLIVRPTLPQTRQNQSMQSRYSPREPLGILALWVILTYCSLRSTEARLGYPGVATPRQGTSNRLQRE